MQTFEEILQQEMAQPVRIKGSDATVTPMQAMIKSVMANAMKGDLAALNFIKNMTRPAETDGDRQHQTAQQQLLTDTRQELSDALTRQGLPPTGYDVELELLARQVMTLRRVAEATDMPRYQVIDILPQKSGADRHQLSETNRIWNDLRKQFLNDWQDLRNQIQQQMLLKRR